MAELEKDGEFSEQLFVHGLGVQLAEGMAEWLHAVVRRELGIGPAQGRRYSWGYPACPDQSEHEKVFKLLDAPKIGLSLSGGYAVEPEQSTLAIVAHHPQAVYFGMKSGKLSEDGSPDAIIADPEGKTGHRIVDGEVVFDALPDEDPAEGEEGDMDASSDGAGDGEAYEESRAEAVADS
jgi:5-methyltetrahydrofolate--homocysteine methyltransferase